MAKKNSQNPAITSSTVQSLLQQKHFEDVYISECKTGPSMCASGLLILDGWAMKKSWARPCATGYEIKVSRSDFLRDTKWPGYLEFCNEFYFVCPTGLIDPSEVGENCGLMWVSKTGTRLYTKKKAPYRDGEIPDSLFRYVLMNRFVCKSDRDANKHPDDGSLSYYKEYLEKKEDKKQTGHLVAYEISRRVSEQVEETKKENARLKRLTDRLSEVQKFLRGMGIDVNSGWGVEPHLRKISQFLAGLPENFEGNLKSTISSLQSVLLQTEKMKRENDNLAPFPGFRKLIEICENNFQGAGVSASIHRDPEIEDRSRIVLDVQVGEDMEPESCLKIEKQFYEEVESSLGSSALSHVNISYIFP